MVAPLLLLGGASLVGGLGFLAGSGGSGGSEFKLFDKAFGDDTNTSTTITDQSQTDNSKKSQKTITNTTNMTDNRSLILTMNSPNAVTKKSDKASAEGSSSANPTQTNPNQFGSPVSTPISNSERSSAGTSGSGSNIERMLLIGGAVAGGVILLNNYTKGGKK